MQITDISPVWYASAVVYNHNPAVCPVKFKQENQTGIEKHFERSML